MKLYHVVSLICLALAPTVVVRADSAADPRAGVGTTGPGSLPCSSFTITATVSGTIIPVNNACTEGFNTGSIEVISPGTSPLSLYSPLLETPTVDDSSSHLSEHAANELLASTGTSLEWTVSCSPDGANTECTLTAPTPNAADLAILAELNKDGLLNDGDCDRDDTILFVPAGCDLFFTTGGIGDLKGDPKGELFSPNESLTSLSFPVPEPGSLPLLFAGLAGLSIFRRKFAR
jgi:hypothetical protein